jgi:hypothetical protein
MTSRGENQGSGSRRSSLVSRVCAGAASTLVIGGALVAGGVATLVTASAHTFGSPATTPLTTGTASGGGFVVGSATLNDTASLNANVTADRVVKFQLWAPNNSTCNTSGPAAVFQQTIQAVKGPGTVHTTGGFSGPEVTGTYHWTAQIVAPNHAVEDSSSCGEPVLLVAGAGRLSTTPSGGGRVGTVIHDMATVTGNAQSPSGTVTFSLFAPSNSSCSVNGAAAVLTSAAINLTSVTPGASHATGPNYTTLVAGTYHWVAVYNGDATYPKATNRCGDEAVVITAAPTPTPRPTPTPTPTPTPPGGVLAISTPSTGGGASPSAAAVGELLLVGGIAISLLALIPRRRRRTF